MERTREPFGAGEHGLHGNGFIASSRWRRVSIVSRLLGKNFTLILTHYSQHCPTASRVWSRNIRAGSHSVEIEAFVRYAPGATQNLYLFTLHFGKSPKSPVILLLHLPWLSKIVGVERRTKTPDFSCDLSEPGVVETFDSTKDLADAVNTPATKADVVEVRDADVGKDQEVGKAHSRSCSSTSLLTIVINALKWLFHAYLSTQATRPIRFNPIVSHLLADR